VAPEIRLVLVSLAALALGTVAVWAVQTFRV
jgi:hypothetical protein